MCDKKGRCRVPGCTETPSDVQNSPFHSRENLLFEVSHGVK